MINRSFSPFPVLTTKRLILRQLIASDVEEIFLLRSDPIVNKYLDRQPSKVSADALKFITIINENVAKNESLYWAITKADNQKLIGTICLYDFSATHNSCEIGYELLTDFQGQGIMQEATTSIIEYAFHTLGITTIDALSHKHNQGSLKLLQKLNFEKTNNTDETNPDLIVFRLSATI
jgi:ribosomal-protein-alanine N-acetyltransferase